MPKYLAREQRLTRGEVEVDVNHRIGNMREALAQLFRREGIAFDPDKPRSRAETLNLALVP
jgi:hypothetical protein